MSGVNMEAFDVDSSESASEEGETSNLSFDELEDITNAEIEDESTEDAEKVDDKIEEEGEESEEKEVSASEKEEDSVDKEETASEEDKDIKKLEGKLGEESLDVAADTKFTAKVNGGEEDVTLQELINNYSGKVAFDKKFQELSEDKKSFSTEKATIEKYIDNFSEKMQNGDILGAMEYFATFANVNPLDFKRQLRDSIAPIIEKRNDMDENERKLADVQEENEFLKTQQEEKTKKESEETASNNEQTNTEFITELKSIQETHKISDQDLEAAAQELIDSYEGEITPKLIGDYYVERQAFSKAEGLLNSVDASLNDDDAVVENLVKIVKENPDFTDDDWQDIVKEAYGNPKKELEKSASKKVQSSKKEVKKVQGKEMSEIDAFFFDDLE